MPFLKTIPIDELERMLLDPQVPDHEIRPYLMPDSSASSAFAPRVRVNPSRIAGVGPSQGVRPQSALLLNALNAADRWRRQRRYRDRLPGWTGPRIVSEGDSWFQYPFLLDDVVDQLDTDFAIFSLDGAGDTLADYLKQDELVSAVLTEKPDAVMLSGGGNDLLGGGRIRHVVEPFAPGRPVESYLQAAFDRRLEEVLDDYQRVLSGLAAAAPDTPVFIHSYAHAVPNSGRWLGDPLASRGIIDRGLQRDIVRLIVDRFHAGLEALLADPVFGRRVTLVDCRDAVAGDLWYDELHPKDEGFAAVAARFRSAMAVVGPRRSSRGVIASGLPATVGAGAAAREQSPAGDAVLALASTFDETVLCRELGRQMTLASGDGDRASTPPGVLLNMPASSIDGASDALYLLGRRVLARMHREVQRLLCGNERVDQEDRAALRSAFDLGQGAVAASLAGLLAGSGFGLPAVAAAIVASILVRRFARSGWEEVCLAWGEQLAPGGNARPRPAGMIAALEVEEVAMATNEQHFCICMTKTNVAMGEKAAVLDPTKWNPQDVIRVRFLEGSQALRDRVKAVAEEWVSNGMANLTFDWIDQGDAEIRIAFVQGNGSWSYLGTDCRQITDQNEPTMNYGWLTDQSTDADVRRVVLHEFGHALGLIHEHQNPEGGIVWNEPAVIADLSGPPNNWSLAQIRENVLKHYDPSVISGSDLDPHSIMMYPIPDAWTVGDFSTGFNDDLSDIDREVIRQAYP
ncbi:GDSL-type esterase/lipase family protein [Jiella avicenniae]|uniref:GDSL-type esterase/lipase family protein n=1 Tax=Jiella avicenniae TaxID=2907202 RepID=A0A9X1P310_9HYPH|nr:GDSL-type esterase/lipase family protein [Jiella avicenniae]MCE7029390.1 GDSL-type esterase/lipase family protein [Jiella avicenniae]